MTIVCPHVSDVTFNVNWYVIPPPKRSAEEMLADRLSRLDLGVSDPVDALSQRIKKMKMR